MSHEPTYLIWLGTAVLLCTPAYFALQAWFAYSWSGGWRSAALAPLFPMVPAALWSIHALSQSSNLWPLAVLLLAPLTFAYLVALWTLRALTERVRFS
jgi:hypothetical protein